MIASQLFLLDANVLIDANRDYYPLERVPEFWSWLEHQGKEGRAALPYEVYEEIKAGNDPLSEWAKRREVKERLQFTEEPDVDLVRHVIAEGYAPDLTDEEIETIGKDPFLVAYALVDPAKRNVVTTERSKPSRTRHNRHLPDVCEEMGIRCFDTFSFLRELDFRTNWQG